MRDLAKLKQDVLAYCNNRKSRGSNVAEYKAPCCGAMLVTAIPDNPREKWDSATTCYECGEDYFYVKTTKGVTVSSLA